MILTSVLAFSHLALPRRRVPPMETAAPPPDRPTTAAALAAAARASLAAFLPDNAVFLAQRATDEWPSEVNGKEKKRRHVEVLPL